MRLWNCVRVWHVQRSEHLSPPVRSGPVVQVALFKFRSNGGLPKAPPGSSPGYSWVLLGLAGSSWLFLSEMSLTCGFSTIKEAAGVARVVKGASEPGEARGARGAKGARGGSQGSQGSQERPGGPGQVLGRGTPSFRGASAKLPQSFRKIL